MTALLLLPAVLATLVLAAHFVRAGNVGFVLLLLALLALLPLRRPWVRRLAQGMLTLGAVEWVATLVRSLNARMAVGEPFGRMVAILGGVALFTLLAAVLFETRRLRARYAAPSPALDAPAARP